MSSPRGSHGPVRAVSRRAEGGFVSARAIRYCLPSTQRGSYTAGVPADVAQLVERNLAKVEVAGSSPVVRSEAKGNLPSLVEWPRGEAAACKAAYTGSNPVSTSVQHPRAIGAVVARFLDTEEVTGSNPVSPTTWDTAFGPRERAERRSSRCTRGRSSVGRAQPCQG